MPLVNISETNAVRLANSSGWYIVYIQVSGVGNVRISNEKACLEKPGITEGLQIDSAAGVKYFPWRNELWAIVAPNTTVDIEIIEGLGVVA